MKKFVLGSSLMLLMMVLFTACKDDDARVDETALPTSSRTFISTHYSAQTITKVELDKDGNTPTGYDVKLSDGTELDFNLDGAVTKIESSSALPASVLAAVIKAEILTYIATNFSGQVVTDWELRANEQEIELNNGAELIFDLNGNFIRRD